MFSADKPGHQTPVRHLLQRLPPALSFPIMVGISGLCVHVLDPGLLHGAEPGNLTEEVNYRIFNRIHHCLSALDRGAMAVDPNVLPSPADDPFGGSVCLTAPVGDLTYDLVHAEDVSLAELRPCGRARSVDSRQGGPGASISQRGKATFGKQVSLYSPWNRPCIITPIRAAPPQSICVHCRCSSSGGMVEKSMAPGVDHDSNNWAAPDD